MISLYGPYLCFYAILTLNPEIEMMYGQDHRGPSPVVGSPLRSRCQQIINGVVYSHSRDVTCLFFLSLSPPPPTPPSEEGKGKTEKRRGGENEQRTTSSLLPCFTSAFLTRSRFRSRFRSERSVHLLLLSIHRPRIESVAAGGAHLRFARARV